MGIFSWGWKIQIPGPLFDTFGKFQVDISKSIEMGDKNNTKTWGGDLGEKGWEFFHGDGKYKFPDLYSIYLENFSSISLKVAKREIKMKIHKLGRGFRGEGVGIFSCGLKI